MQAQFDATVDDFVDVTLRTLAGSRTVRVQRWQGVLTTASLIAFSMYLIFPASQPFKLLAGLLTLAFIPLANLVTYKSFLRGKLRAIAKEQIGGEGPVRVRVELTPFGIEVKQLGTRYSNDWSAIERLEETQDAIYFYKRDKSCLAVRTRAFESQEIRNQFIELAKKYIDAQSGERPSNS